jgi:phosphoenolpyruvate carboxykinase (GTP)
MLPFCGYNMADYFAHWLEFAERFDESKLPSIYYVNWFRKSSDGRWLWPGFGENSRVLEWIFRRRDGKASAETTPIGLVPRPEDLVLEGLSMSAQDLRELLSVNVEDWRREIPLIEEHYAQFGDRLPAALRDEVARLAERVDEAS